jgi:hypothetical protein
MLTQSTHRPHSLLSRGRFLAVIATGALTLSGAAPALADMPSSARATHQQISITQTITVPSPR